jgi:hypothetical protein
VAFTPASLGNEWAFLNCYWDPATGYGYLDYRDDDETDLKQTASTFTFAPQTAGHAAYISFSGAGSFDGAFDNAAIWNRPPAGGEIDTLWNAGAGTFYAAFWDAFFSGNPVRFAWSQMPEIRRVH